MLLYNHRRINATDKEVNNMLNVNMLKGRMVEKGITVSELSKELNINQATFYRKMKNNSFKIFETDIIMNTLQLSPSEANKIFFAKKSHKCDDDKTA